MPRFARFAVSFLSLAAFAAVSYAANVREMADPRQLDTLFPKSARVRIVNVWATWCAPCVAEMPDLRAIDQAFGAEVSVAGVSLDDMIPGATKQKVVDFLDKQRIAFANVYYTGKPDDLGEHLRFDGELPITLIFDTKGKELWRHQGRLDRQKTIAVIRDLLRRQR
jgi:thiol-disulfide isomerase/thioredoxin